MASYEVLNVFPGPGGGGNLLGVFLDGASVPDDERQGVAADLGFAETVFVDDAGQGTVRIFTPLVELPFAGHPLVGTAWLLRRAAGDLAALHPPAGEVAVAHDGRLTWIRARPEWSPAFELRQLPSPLAVEQYSSPGAATLLDVWAYEDEGAGTVRSRVFAGLVGVDEDEATGSAALLLAATLGRSLEIHQGTCSVLHARPGPDGTAEVGGLVTHVASRKH